MPWSPERVFVIAEAGVNHDGDVQRALALVDAAADAGADAVKFQTFRADALVTARAPKAEYQVRTTGDGESQRAMLRRLELDASAHHRIVAHCRHRGIEFMSSPFDRQCLRFLVQECGVARVKLGSGELTNGPLIYAAVRSGRPLIMSTGMATLTEVEDALGVVAVAALEPGVAPTPDRRASALLRARAQGQLAERVTLLHCNTAYPTPVQDVNLRAMATLREAGGVPVGFSDHSLGVAVPAAAAALGAVVIEKHLTLDRHAKGPDHEASLPPDEFRMMVQMVRTVCAALGCSAKQVSASERPQRSVARKSLVAAVRIRPGELLGAHNLTAKRPGDGVSPMAFWSVVGTVAARDYRPDEPLDPLNPLQSLDSVEPEGSAAATG